MANTTAGTSRESFLRQTFIAAGLGVRAVVGVVGTLASLDQCALVPICAGIGSGVGSVIGSLRAASRREMPDARAAA